MNEERDLTWRLAREEREIDLFLSSLLFLTLLEVVTNAFSPFCDIFFLLKNLAAERNSRHKPKGGKISYQDLNVLSLSNPKPYLLKLKRRILSTLLLCTKLHILPLLLYLSLLSHMYFSIILHLTAPP